MESYGNKERYMISCYKQQCLYGWDKKSPPLSSPPFLIPQLWYEKLIEREREGRPGLS